MTFAELIVALQKKSSDRLVLGLIELLQQWRSSGDTAEALHRSAERYIEDSWTESDAEHNVVYALWARFRSQCILGRGGMTINKRLYCFDLFERWDRASSEEERAAVRNKIDFIPDSGA